MNKAALKPFSSNRKRLDQRLVEQHGIISRERAQALILAGKVLVDGQTVFKSGIRVPSDATVRVLEDVHPYVSRGGVKLAGALEKFSVDPEGKTAMDVGASTGGFTDCLLKFGAKRVYSVDVGYGQLAWSLRIDPRVVVIERTHIRDLKKEQVDSKIDLATVDVSFISLKKVIPPLLTFLTEGAHLLALIKPQFEVGKGKVGKGGIIRNPDQREKVKEEMWLFFLNVGLKPIGMIPSDLAGQKGNQEYFIYARRKNDDRP